MAIVERLEERFPKDLELLKLTKSFKLSVIQVTPLWTVSILAGLLAVATITYKFRDDLMNNTNSIRLRLEDAKTTLDHVAAGTASQSHPRSQPAPARSFIGESQHYVSKRLIPSLKDNWNSQVAGAAQTLIRTDVPSYTKKVWDENIAPNFK